MWYTFLVQNVISKATYSWILEDLTPESIYHKFDIALYEDMLEGEYEYVLIINPNQVEIEINDNNIFKSHLIGDETVIETFGILRIGNQKCPITYDKQQNYKVYER